MREIRSDQIATRQSLAHAYLGNGCRTGARLGCAFVIMLFACNEPPAGSPTDDDIDEIAAVAEIEWMIGEDDGDPDYVFGSVNAGLALDGQDRLYVPDGRADQIKVFTGDGTFLHAFGRAGDGPGDIRAPCCLAVDQSGRLWVWNAGDLVRHLRYDVFDTDPSAFRFRIPGAEMTTTTGPHALPDTGGRIVHVTMNRERATPEVYLQLPGMGMQRLPPIGEEWIRKWRVLADTLGREIGRVPVASAPPESLALLRVVHANTTYWLVVPGSASSLDAHTRAGFARAVSSRYRIDWHDATGALIRTIERPIEGPALTPDERAALAADHKREQEAALVRGGVLPDVPIPDRKHPLERLFFDLDGGLWVQHAVATGDSMAVADVYHENGTYVHTIRWPAHVRIDRGVIRGATAYGVSLNELDVARVVKLRIHPVQ